MKRWLGVVVCALSVTAATAASQNIGRIQAPDALILQGPGSDIQRPSAFSRLINGLTGSVAFWLDKSRAMDRQTPPA